MNGRRRKLGRSLTDRDVTQIVVGHRDGLVSFEVERLRAAVAAQGREIVILDTGEVEDDLVRGMTEVLTSFFARLYGRRGARDRALQVLGCARAE
jgi:putative resolvase